MDSTTNQTTLMGLLDRGIRWSIRGDATVLHLEIAWVVLAYAYWGPYIARATAKASRKTVVYSVPRAVFLLHIAVSAAEVIRYHIRLGLGAGPGRPEATAIDLILCGLQSFSSLWLAAAIHHKIQKGALEVTRATFHAMVFQRLFATGMAIWLGERLFGGLDGHGWHAASIKLLQNFIYARVLIISVPPYLKGLETYAAKYTFGIVGCHLLGMWEGGYPQGNFVYAVLLMVLMGLDRSVQGFRSNSIIKFMTVCGFVTRPEPEEDAQEGKTEHQ